MAKIQTFRLEEAVGRAVKSTRGRGVEGVKSPDLKVVQFPIDTGIPEINLRFGYDQIGDGFFSPRHRHNFDQFRYVVHGETNIAKGRDLHQGEIGYFPEGTYYGPLTQRGPVGLLVMQFPGPQGEYRITDGEKQAAMDALRADGGYFEDGIYTKIKPDGGKVNQDSYEAVWQKHTGRPVTYAKPRYAAPIMIRPQGFQWRTDPKRPGVEVKRLGSFHEYGTAISIWRLAPGTTIAPEVLDAPEVRCVIAGATHYDGRLLDDKSTYYIPEGVRTQPIESPTGAEFLVFSLPMYARATWEKAHGRTLVAA
jgi:hypothetical protein